MAFDSSSLHAQAALALHRFGLGPRPGDIAKLAADPRGALLAELDVGSKPLNDPALVDSAKAGREAYAYQQERRAARQAPPPQAKPDMDAGGNDMAITPPQPAKTGPGVAQEIYRTEAKARYRAALDADIGLTERLVWFWSNHFCVAADKGPTRSLCGAYEREAIRPFVFGTFTDMLLAVETHPAMPLYLDNTRSIGPRSIIGERQHKGLNENLAREILELHTLGVRAGYTQADVTSFAKIITGWTIASVRQDPENGRGFRFNKNMHEPGDHTVLGKSYAENGFEQGRDVLRNLAGHPATAAHIATKLVTHFVADKPLKPLVDRLASRFRETNGDLKEVTRTLLTAPEVWNTPPGKLKKPGEWTVAAMRATGIDLKDGQHLMNTQKMLGEPLWQPPAPKGFPDDSAAWMDGLAQRLDIANQMARLAGNNGMQPDDIVDVALGPLASADTRQTIKRAESRQQALALLMMAPEFQRR